LTAVRVTFEQPALPIDKQLEQHDPVLLDRVDVIWAPTDQ